MESNKRQGYDDEGAARPLYILVSLVRGGGVLIVYCRTAD